MVSKTVFVKHTYTQHVYQKTDRQSIKNLQNIKTACLLNIVSFHTDKTVDNNYIRYFIKYCWPTGWFNVVTK